MNKDIILIISEEMAGGGGCYNLRIQQIVNYINQTNMFGVKAIVSHIPIFDGNILARTKGILIQRPFHPMPWLKNYRELQPKYMYKITFELDDAFWNIMPDYNHNYYSPRDWGMIDKLSAENLKYFDCGIVTTEFLAKYLGEHFNFWNVVRVPNAADRSIYGSPRKDFFREKPLVISAGAGQHVLEPNPISKQMPTGWAGKRGDYCGQWPEWLIKRIDDIDLHYFTGIPYFLECIKDKIQLHGWQNTTMYSSELNRVRPDIIIAPLKNNDFNRAKSSLKFVEAAACGAVLMGSDFPGGPYEMIHPLCKVPDEPTVEQLDKVYDNILKNWKDIVDYQYKYINENGWWLQSESYMATWLNAVAVSNRAFI